MRLLILAALVFSVSAVPLLGDYRYQRQQKFYDYQVPVYGNVDNTVEEDVSGYENFHFDKVQFWKYVFKAGFADDACV